MRGLLPCSYSLPGGIEGQGPQVALKGMELPSLALPRLYPLVHRLHTSSFERGEAADRPTP